ncbi:MAG: hypothetical protein KDD19_29550 [Phaeodactylibacter sp.]|nr:hypothetical protein [Phaeodactylibacter sp.]MCB9053345.1 hypothetical protein [Lewinellaceae bacterium]MCB9053668.1 hypothetical protein [Lewinellaceae bacterium]
MRTIDGTRYISASEYADIKGISKGRVSQLKSTLPFERFDDIGVELVNYDLLELELDERRLMDLKYSSQRALHQYSYGQLGKFFAKLLGELTKAEGEAKEQAVSLEELLNAAKSDLALARKANEELTINLQTAQEQLAEQQQLAEKMAQALATGQAENERLREKAADWEVRYEQQGAQKEELLQKVMELQEERAQHLARIAVQESQRDAQGDLRAEFDELKKLVSRLSERRDEKG